jgi:hypothetical protein
VILELSGRPVTAARGSADSFHSGTRSYSFGRASSLAGGHSRIALVLFPSCLISAVRGEEELSAIHASVTCRLPPVRLLE